MTTKQRVDNEMASLKGLRLWMSHALEGQVPQEHEAALGDLLAFLDEMTQPKPTGRGLTTHFLRAIGVLPKSERSRKYGLGPLAGDLKGRLASVSKFTLTRLYALKSHNENKEGSGLQEPPLPLSEPCSEQQGKGRLAEELEKFSKSDSQSVVDLSQDDFDAMCAEAFGAEGDTDATCVSVPNSEELFGRELEGFISAREEKRTLSDAQIEELKASPNDTISKTTKTHTRVGFQIVVEETEVAVESAFSRESGASVRADTSDIGPARSRTNQRHDIRTLLRRILFLSQGRNLPLSNAVSA